MAEPFSDDGNRLRVEMIDGQGDSFRIESPTGATMQVDSGHTFDNGEHVLDNLDAHGVGYLDHLVMTHDDWDHIGGDVAIVEEFDSDGIGTVHGPEIIEGGENNTTTARHRRETLEANGLEENRLEEGDKIDFDGVTIDILNPSPSVSSEDRNENSLVLQATYGEQSALLTSDIGPKATQHLIDEYGEQLTTVDVLVGPHHGTDNPMWGDLVETCESDTIFFSYDENNGDDHPKDTTLDQTRDAAFDSDIYTKPLHGTTTAMLDGHSQTTAVPTTDRLPTPTDDIKLAKYYDPDIEQFDLEEGITATDLSDETPTEVFDNPNVVDPEAVRRLHSRLDAFNPQTEVAEQRIETLHEHIDTVDPRSESYDQHLDLFAEQIDQLEADAEIYTEQSEDTDHNPDEESKEALHERITALEQKNEELTETLSDRDETIEDLEAENNELIDTKNDLVDEKREVVDEKQELSDEILDLKEELQNVRAKIQQSKMERENEAATDTDSLSKGQRWVMNPDAEKPDPIPEQYEQLVGKPLPETLRNGGTETAESERENDREDERDGRNDTDQEPDDETPAGGPDF